MNNKILLLSSFLVVVVAVVLYRRPCAYLPWHETPQWHAVLELYDQMRDDVYLNNENHLQCQMHELSTTIGPTIAYACGDNPSTENMVVLLHGGQGTALMWQFWMPSLVRHFYTVAVDFPCDIGRSRPVDGDVGHCPSSQEDVATWVAEVVKGMRTVVMDIKNANGSSTFQGELQEPPRALALIGYSMGSFMTMATALHQPDLVEKVVTLAPAATYTNFNIKWVLRAMVAMLVFPSPERYKTFCQTMLADPSMTIEQLYHEHPAIPAILGAASMMVGLPVLNVYSLVFDDEQLASVCGSGTATETKRCLLGIGELETVTNPIKASERATKAGAKVIVYPNTGHFMYYEQPSRDNIVDDVIEFLQATTE